MRDKRVAVLDLGSASDEQRSRTIEQVGGGHCAVSNGRGSPGRSVRCVLSITSVGLGGYTSTSAGRGILHQRAVTEGVSVEGGIFAKNKSLAVDLEASTRQIVSNVRL